MNQRFDLTKVRLSIAFAGLALLCLILGLADAAVFAKDVPPQAFEGRLDLSRWSFRRDGVVPLNGEWEFYWEELLTPHDFPRSKGSPPADTIQVPGAWPSAVAQRSDTTTVIGKHGYGTYRLVVQLPAAEGPEQGVPLAIFIPYVNTSYRMWVDGRLVAENGRVASSPDRAVPQIRPRIASFFPERDTAEIIVQVANFHFREGGIPSEFSLGLSDTLNMIQRRREWIDAFLTGLGLFTVLFFMALYAQQRENRGAVYFSLFVLMLTVRISFLGNVVAYRLFPDIPWEIGLKIEYSLGYLGAPLFFMYLRSVFPHETSRFVVRLAWTISLLAIAVVLIFPGRISSQMIPAYLFVLFGYVIYGISVAALAVSRKRDDGSLVMVGAIIFLVSVFTSVLGYAGMPQGFEAMHFGVGALIVTQGLILARRFAQYVRTQKRLLAENAAMLERTRYQLSEVQRYRRLMQEREEGLRSQIAEMLHGRTQGRLLAALRNIDLAFESIRRDPSESEQRLNEAKGLLKLVREEDVREVGRRLHPSAVRAGLIPAVETLLRGVEDAYQVTLDVDPAIETLDSPEDLKIPYELRLGVYRILEEALNNIARHAEAQNVHVSVALSPGPNGDSLLLEIRDDGKGCDPDQVTMGLGLQTIDARISDLGGSWRLESSPGQGAALYVKLPLSLGRPVKSSASPERPGVPEPDSHSLDPEEARKPDSPLTTETA